MANEVVMPRLGWTMEVGQLVEWLKRDGEAVAAGEPLFTVESDKSVTEVEALDSGVLRIPPDAPGPGVDLPVGAVLAYLVPPGTAAPFEQPDDLGPGDQPAQSVEKPQSPLPAPASKPTRRPTPTASPRARRVAAELGVDWTVLTGGGASGRIAERDVRAAAALAPAAPPSPFPTLPPRAAPAVRRLAAEHGVDLDQLAAGTAGKRISRADVRAASQPAAASTPHDDDIGTPLGPVRRLTAARMTESARTVAPVTLTTDADATELVRLRDRMKVDLAQAAVDIPLPTFTDLIVRLTALALLEHPELNASLIDDRIVRHAAVHVGVAVDAERGLLVPVVRDAHLKSVHAIAADSARLIEQARVGAIATDDIRGGTFTVTNLGMFEIDAFTPIVNLPECAILGVGRIVPRPVVVDEATEAVAVRKMLALSLTFDHRIVDGAPAARFLQRVKRLIEHPYAWATR